MPLLSSYTNNLIEAGLDEVGIGCLAGPIVSSAVIFDKGYNNPYINDSKTLSYSERERLSIIIKDSCLSWSIGISTNDEIDQYNSLNSTYLAMYRAINKLSLRPHLLLIDGIRYRPQAFENYVCIKKGDSKFLSIAAASIIAKDYRDKLMIKMSEKYPNYQWDQNKGYPTKQHKKAIEKHGTTKYHRLSFFGIFVLDKYFIST